MRKNKTEETFVDDGHTIVNMNVPGMKGYKTPEEIQHQKEMAELKLSRKEKWAIWKAGLLLLGRMIIMTGLFFGILYCCVMLLFGGIR